MTFTEPGSPLLSISEATVVKSGKRILDNLTLNVLLGSHTAILGANGSGKSSLIKLITRQYYPIARRDDKPTVSILGKDRWDVFELRSFLGIVSADLFQDFIQLPETTGIEATLSGYFAAIGLAPHHKVTDAMRQGAYDALDRVNARHLENRPIGEMSTGEARRILIARAIVTKPIALILDEPTTGLDIAARDRFLRIIRGLAEGGTTIVMVTHHVEEILPEIEHVIYLKSGRVLADGSKSQLMTAKRLSELFDAKIALHRSGGYYTAQVEEPSLPISP
jgi:iron complex transport system ATP-binding protein